MTAQQLAIKTWSKCVTDRSLRYYLKNASHKARMDWARAQVQAESDGKQSKQLIGRAATIVLRWAEQNLN